MWNHVYLQDSRSNGGERRLIGFHPKSNQEQTFIKIIKLLTIKFLFLFLFNQFLKFIDSLIIDQYQPTWVQWG